MGHKRIKFLCFAFILARSWLVGNAACFAQATPAGDLAPAVNLNEVSSSTRKQLAQVNVFAADGQWDDAVETLRRVMDTDGQRLIAVRSPDQQYPEFRRYISLRRYGHIRLSQWSKSAPEALKLYRRRVDPLAQRWFKQAVEQRDAHRLQRIIDEMFTSRFGDDALFRLGVHMLEQGDFTRARQCWESISPLLRTPTAYEPILNAGPGRPLWLGVRGLDLNRNWSQIERLLTRSAPSDAWLSYPDSDLNLNEVRARLALVSILEGNVPRARLEIALLDRLAPAAAGHLAGSTGAYVPRLKTLLEDSRKWPAVKSNPDWPTFAGSPARDGQARGELDIRGRPLWKRALPRLNSQGEVLSNLSPRVAERRSGLLPYHPVIHGSHLFWTEPEYLKALDLRSGKALWPLDNHEPGDAQYGAVRKSSPAAMVSRPNGPHVGVPRFTLSVKDTRLFARVGPAVTSAGVNARIIRRQKGYIVGLDLNAQGKLLPGFPYYPPGEDWAYDGAPLVVRQNLYVAMRRSDDIGAQSHVACYDMETGKQRWRQRVCSAETLGKGQWPELTHNLLTMGRGTIYFNSNQGVVAALRASDGQVQWLMQYPRAPVPTSDPDRTNHHFFRDLTPCLLHRGMLMVAPGDCNQIFALDAATGLLIWALTPERASDVVHLLGVGQEHLLASGEFLYWFDAYTGRVAAQFPGPAKLAPGHAAPSPRGYGRGLLTGDLILWPTQESIYVFEQRPQASERGKQPVLRKVIDLVSLGGTGGNVLLSDGVLIISAESRIMAFDSTGNVNTGTKQ